MESEDVFVPPEDVGPVEEPVAAVGDAEAAQAEGQVCHDPESQKPWPHLEDYSVFESVDKRILT